MNSKAKICIVTSKGGHLQEMNELYPLISKYTRMWITFRGKDVDDLLKDESIYFAQYPDSRHIGNFFRNLILALRILRRAKPDVLISCGAGLAVPFFIVGKLYGIKLIFIEPYDFVAYPSVTGRILYTFADVFLVQHKIQQKWYPNAQYWGSLF